MTTIGDTTGRVSKAQGDVTQGSIYVRLVDLQDRKHMIGRKFSQFETMSKARQFLVNYPDLRSSVQLPAAISTGTVNADVEMTLVGPDLAKLNEYADQIILTLRKNPGLADVDTTLALRKPEVRVEVNRERASDLGASIQTIASTLRVLVGGEIVSDFKDNQLGELYDVWLRAIPIDRIDPRTIANLTIPSTRTNSEPPTRSSQLITLSNLATLSEAKGPSQIDRFARNRKISIIANLNGAATSDAVNAFNQAAAQLEDGKGLPADYQLIPSGRAKTQAESNAAFLFAFLTSLLFMYMILAAQFESFVHPITILLAVPLTIPFAILSLILLGQALTIYSILGVFLLFGIVKKNGILQVDYTNILRHRAAEDPMEVPPTYRTQDSGLSTQHSSWQRFLHRLSADKRTRTWAIMEANRTRLRPILMTTLMLIAGMIPIALGEGPGSASRASMAKVIVGGQAMSLLLSLLVTPVAYSLFDDLALLRRTKTAPPSTRRQEAPELPALAEVPR
jgi:HAE1 family hydrophobic/amphiphilic exporter-1